MGYKNERVNSRIFPPIFPSNISRIKYYKKKKRKIENYARQLWIDFRFLFRCISINKHRGYISHSLDGSFNIRAIPVMCIYIYIYISRTKPSFIFLDDDLPS